MTTTYAILATVTLQHDYYADGRCNDFELVPSTETAAAMKGLFILTKTVGNTLLLLVKVNDEGATYVTLPADLKLSFYVELDNTNFVNYTNVPYGGSGSIFYFSNLYKTKVGSSLYLNKRVLNYSGATAYAIGDMVLSGGNVFEAIKPVSAGSHATSDSDYWFQRASEQYVHSGDALQLSDGVLRITTAPATVFDISVFGLNDATTNYDVLIRTQKQIFTQNVSTITLNLQDLPPAQYKVAVNGVTQFVYIDKTASYARVFGILELYNRFPAADDFGLLDADGAPKGLDHVIRFPNRLAIWKYITRTTTVTAIENTATPGAFTAAALPKQFVSVAPLPLKQQPIKTLQVKSGATVLASRLANPPPDRIATYTDGDGNKYFCAEMYLNY